ncbi:helix-hairpin-helix domain-containing protein, partial [bacterium]|nr:helix-hairpin-helix domain-containing protein [bacterium]
MCRSLSNRDIAVLVLAVVLAALPVRCRADDSASDMDDVADADDVGACDSALREVLMGLDDESAAIDGLEELLREAAAFREHPVDVNSAGLAQLLRVPFLGPGLAVRIVAQRDRMGPAESLDELVARGCLSHEALAVVRPYLIALSPVPEAVMPAVGDNAADTAMKAVGDTARDSAMDATPQASQKTPLPVTWELRLRATTQERWDAPWGARDVLGAVGTFARLRVSYAQRLDLSVACEKDIGEASLADHSVVSLVWRGAADVPEDGPALSVGLGDFAGSWGQGLLLRSGGFPS